MPPAVVQHRQQERVCDRSVVALLRGMLRAGVMQDGQVRRSVTGTQQGGVVSPLLANIYLHRIDGAWDAREDGVLVRFADDVVVMWSTERQAQAALAQLTGLLADLGLEPKAAKTRIVQLAAGGDGVEFLGFHTDWSAVTGDAPANMSCSWLVRPRTRRCSMPATGSGN